VTDELPTCPRHPGRTTGRSCTRCGAPACPDCLRDAPVGAHCVDCVRADREPVANQVRRTVRSNRRFLALDDLLVTRVLIALNATVFVLTDVVKSVSPTQIGLTAGGWTGTAMIGVAEGEWWRLVSSGFLHFGLLHLGMNMLALWNLGQSLEPQLGRWRFAGLYLVALLGGSAGALATSPNGLTGGASGAIFGLLGALAVAMRSRGVPLMKTSIGPVLVLNLVLTLGLSGISVGGHLGGLGTGGLLGWVLLRPRRRTEHASASGEVLSLVALGAVAVGAALWLAANPLGGGSGLRLPGLRF